MMTSPARLTIAPPGAAIHRDAGAGVRVVLGQTDDRYVLTAACERALEEGR